MGYLTSDGVSTQSELYFVGPTATRYKGVLFSDYCWIRCFVLRIMIEVSPLFCPDLRLTLHITAEIDFYKESNIVSSINPYVGLPQLPVGLCGKS